MLDSGKCCWGNVSKTKSFHRIDSICPLRESLSINFDKLKGQNYSGVFSYSFFSCLPHCNLDAFGFQLLDMRCILVIFCLFERGHLKRGTPSNPKNHDYNSGNCDD